MEYLGTGFVLTIAGMRLRVRIALEDTPERVRNAPAASSGAPYAARPPAPSERQRRPEDASSMN
jgi:hypothetical protein